MTPEEFKSTLKAIAELTPSIAELSTVVLVAAKNPTVTHLGTGTLVAVADHYFVLTAAHVAREAVERKATLGISGASDKKFVATPSNWIVTREANGSDPLDIALCRLNPEQVERLEHRKFVRMVDISLDEDQSSGYFIVCGFPAIWSSASSTINEVVSLSMLQYGAAGAATNQAALDNYNPEVHFLIDANPKNVLDSNGARVSFRTRTGYPASMPADLRGVSGCSVWRVGRLHLAERKWFTESPSLVGVETGVYERRSLIKATRWKAVIALLSDAYPALVPALDISSY